jgi:hypothetical protein
LNPKDDAEERARERDLQIQAKLNAYRVPAPKELLTQIRAYLLWQRDEEHHPGNLAEAELKLRFSDGRALINLGPTVDRGPDEHHFYFKSGARLSFGITVESEGSKGRLISYRFDYRQDKAPRMPLIRFELRESAHHEPLREPMTHFHPGIENLRLPTELVDPFEILDLLFFVIDPNIK